MRKELLYAINSHVASFGPKQLAFCECQRLVHESAMEQNHYGGGIGFVLFAAQAQQIEREHDFSNFEHEPERTVHLSPLCGVINTSAIRGNRIRLKPRNFEAPLSKLLL
jgi:hypothetical protein